MNRSPSYEVPSSQRAAPKYGRRESASHVQTNTISHNHDVAIVHIHQPPAVHLFHSGVSFGVRNRRQVSHRHQMLLLEHLTSSKAFYQEGIFRVCGRSDVIDQAESRLRKSLLFPKQMIKMLDDMSIYDSADLLKMILRKRKTPLVSEACLNLLRLAKSLQCVDSTVTLHSVDERVALFINSSLSVLPKNDQELCRALCDFLRLVILSKESSMMDVRNVAAIFALLFFGAPEVSDPYTFARECEQRTKMLEWMMTLYTEHHDMFRPSHALLEPLVAKVSIRRKMASVLRGEQVTLFFCSDQRAYILTSVHVIHLDISQLHSLFEPIHPHSECKGRGKRATAHRSVRGFLQRMW